MDQELNTLIEQARAALAQAADGPALANAKARFLGKSGRVTELLKSLAALPVEEKKARGAEINVLKSGIEAALTARRAGTYLGGSGYDAPFTLAVAPDSSTVYLTGFNSGGGFPTVNAQQGTFAGGGDGFVSRLSTDLTAVNRIPNPFSFIHQSNVPPNSVRTSNEVRLTITPTPPNNQQTAYVTNAVGSEFCIATQPGVCVTPYVGCASPCFSTGWFSGSWDFLSGDYVAVRHTSANPGGTAAGPWMTRYLATTRNVLGYSRCSRAMDGSSRLQ